MKPNSVHEQFKAVVAAHAGRIAVSDGVRALSYAELDALAEQVGRALAGRGVGQGSRVIVAMARSIDFVAMILAIVRVGGVYVPVRKGISDADLSNIAVQAGAACIVVDALEDVCSDAATVLAFDTLLKDVAGSPLPTLERHPEYCCYMMFTSGSTGAPKGVMVPDRGVLRLVLHTNFTQITPDDTIFLTADPAFDASTFEIWGALLNGATIVVKGADFDPSAFAKDIEQHAVTIIWLTAGLFHALGANRPQIFRPLRQLLAGGDTLNGNVVRAVLEACPGLEIVNGYGPTENTTFTCCHRMTKDNPPTGDVPIGLPITGTTVHLLGEDGQPVAPGETGTLYAGGDGVALGYLDRPDDTSFVSLPDIEDGRLYNTGDRAMFRDGVYHFLGRRDSLVKIRGYRVSTNYVREQMYRLGYVNEVALSVENDPKAGARVTALVCVDDASRGVKDVRHDCLSLMPPYMIPETIRIVDQILLTPNGKVKPQQSMELG